MHGIEQRRGDDRWGIAIDVLAFGLQTPGFGIHAIEAQLAGVNGVGQQRVHAGLLLPEQGLRAEQFSAEAPEAGLNGAGEVFELRLEHRHALIRPAPGVGRDVIGGVDFGEYRLAQLFDGPLKLAFEEVEWGKGRLLQLGAGVDVCKVES